MDDCKSYFIQSLRLASEHDWLFEAHITTDMGRISLARIYIMPLAPTKGSPCALLACFEIKRPK